MSELDDKIRSILQSPHRDDMGTTVMTFPSSKTIDQIMQAFIDDYWIDTKEAFTHYGGGTRLMTGQEWYDRFIKEFKYSVNSDEGVVVLKSAMNAAKKSAGIE